MNGWTDRYIILPLRVFELVACSRMRCPQLRAAQMINKKRCGVPDRDMERQTNKLNCSPLGSFGTKYEDQFFTELEPNTKKIIQLKKSQKARGQPDKRTEILYCHSGDLNPWPATACSARNYGPRK